MNTGVESESVIRKILADIRAWSEIWHMPVGPRLVLRLALLEPGFQLALSIRLQELFGRLPVLGKVLRRILWYVTTVWFSCDIDPQASIAGGLHIPHAVGIVIGGKTRIGRHVHILQGVTCGRLRDSDACPTIDDHAVVHAGAQLIGGISIGKAALIGANAVVLRDVPPGCVAVGVPARIIRREARRPAEPDVREPQIASDQGLDQGARSAK